MHKQMDKSLRDSIIQVLKSKYGMRHSGENFGGGVCPSCNKKELWAVGAEPWSVQCNRIENCGYKGLIRDLHPELFKSVTERAVTALEFKEDPKAVAKYYLSNVRGLNPTRCGAFTQEKTYNKKTGKGSETIRFTFPVENGECYWERIIEDIGGPKAHFKPGTSYSGFGWVTPEFDKDRKEVWIVEGIFDALALQEHGINAISAMTCHNFPERTLLEQQLDPLTTIIIALDSNKAGYQAIPKMIQRAKDAGFINIHVALTNNKNDWNDCHLNNKLNPSDIELYRYNGDLFTADSAYEKAHIMWLRNLWNKFILEHNYKTYWAEVKGANRQKDDAQYEEPELVVTEIGSCTIDFLYVERSIETDETRFYLEINNGKKTAKGIFTGKHFKSATEFGARVIDTLPGSNFSGKAAQLEALYNLKAQNIKTVNTIEYVGYCPEAEAYVYPQFAVKNGKLYKPNEEDYYDLGGYYIKNSFTPGSFNPSTDEKKVDWLDDYWSAFGRRGLVALAYFFGSLFATQIRSNLGFYPFLEFTGEAGSGKTATLEFLWKIMGRESYEGINPTISTNVGRYRTLCQFSNMPTSYIEGQSESKDAKKGKDDWLYELKPMFNGRIVRAKGNKNNGNDTDETPFMGSIVISQNVKIQADEATLTRLIYIHMTSEHHTPAGARAAQRLFNLEMNDCSSFLLQTILKEKEIMSLILEKYQHYHQTIEEYERIKHTRIKDVHALFLAILNALVETYNISYQLQKETEEYVYKIAEDRQKDLDHDPDELLEFWYLLEDLARGDVEINHSNNPHFELAINLNHIAQIVKDNGLPFLDVPLLRRLLPGAKTYEFLENKTVKSSINGRTTRCYVFKWNGDWKQ